MLRNRFPEQCALKDPAVACLHWTSLAEGNANFSIVIVFRYADDLMAGFEHREEAERLQGLTSTLRALKVRKQKEGRYLRHESRDSPSFPTMYGGREALPDDHTFRGPRGRVRALCRHPQLGCGTEKTGEPSQRKTNPQLASGAFSCRVTPFTAAGERTKKALSRGGRRIWWLSAALISQIQTWSGDWPRTHLLLRLIGTPCMLQGHTAIPITRPANYPNTTPGAEKWQ
jgi:hypothetical protein